MYMYMYMYMYGVQGCVDGCALIESVLTGVVVHFHFEITTTAVVAHMTSPWCCVTAGHDDLRGKVLKGQAWAMHCSTLGSGLGGCGALCTFSLVASPVDMNSIMWYCTGMCLNSDPGSHVRL